MTTESGQLSTTLGRRRWSQDGGVGGVCDSSGSWVPTDERERDSIERE